MIDVSSVVTGSVWKIEASVGQKLAPGDVIMILESMKMEIPIESPVAGTVVAIPVANGQSIEEGTVLVRIETA